MALGDILFASGYDHQDTGVFDIGFTAGSFDTTKRRTPQSAASWHGNAADNLSSLRNPADGTVFLGSEFVFGIGVLRSSAETQPFFRLYSPNSVSNVEVTFDTSGHLRVTRGGTVLATGSRVFAIDQWVWVWGYTKIHDTTGVFRLKADNQIELATTTGQDTRADAGANGDKADRISVARSNFYYVDDCYVLDATGTTDYGDDIDIGEVTTPWLAPNAAGDTTQLTRGGTDSGANWSQVEEVPPNDVTDYVYSPTVAQLDLYNLAATSGAAAIKGIVTRVRWQKSDAGALSARQILKSGGTVSNGADVALPTSWATSPRNLRKNPVTTNDFTPSEVDALQVGVEVRT